MIYIIFISNDMEPAVKLKKNILSYKQTNRSIQTCIF